MEAGVLGIHMLDLDQAKPTEFSSRVTEGLVKVLAQSVSPGARTFPLFDDGTGSLVKIVNGHQNRDIDALLPWAYPKHHIRAVACEQRLRSNHGQGAINNDLCDRLAERSEMLAIRRHEGTPEASLVPRFGRRPATTP